MQQNAKIPKYKHDKLQKDKKQIEIENQCVKGEVYYMVVVF